MKKNKRNKILIGLAAIFFILMIIFTILDNYICLLFFILGVIPVLFMMIDELIEDKKARFKKPPWWNNPNKCIYCGGDLIWKEDLWITDEEWGIPEDYMCVSCGKGRYQNQASIINTPSSHLCLAPKRRDFRGQT